MPDKKIIQKVVLAGLIIKDGRVLILQRTADEESYANYWELPSGKKEPLESTLESLKREIFEEAGLEVEIIKPISVFDYQIEKPDEIRDTTQINFLVTPKESESQVKLSTEHQNFAWVSEKDLDQYQMSDETKKVIKLGLKSDKNY